MTQTSIIIAATAFLLLTRCLGYSPIHNGKHRESSLSEPSIRMSQPETTRRRWLAQIGAMTSIASGMAVSPLAMAEENEAPVSPSYSIQKCINGGKAPCVSTANVRNVDLYSPPWTYDRTPDEVMSRLKGAVVADSNCQILEQDGSQYLKVAANRISATDELEFVINDADKVVFFRSKASNDNADFGANKKRLEEIRKRAGIFGVMGDSMMTADSASVGARGNGPLGQLKAFYGLQSGGGFEDVVLE